MRYADIINNDVVNGNGVCVSFWCQGCHFHCSGCHNQQTWDFNGGKERSREELIDDVISRIGKNGVKRNLSILGGEPLCEENIDFVNDLIDSAKNSYPDIKVFLWTGYTFEDLFVNERDPWRLCKVSEVLSKLDVLIDGRFEKDKRDVSLAFRGSSNQRVIDIQRTLKSPSHKIHVLSIE